MFSNERVIYLCCEDLYRTPDDDVGNSVYLHVTHRSTEFCWSIFRKAAQWEANKQIKEHYESNGIIMWR